MVHGFGPWGEVGGVWGGWVKCHCATGSAGGLAPGARATARGGAADCIAIARRSAPAAGRCRGVVLLHGILNYPGIMVRAADALADAGWAVANIGYSSTRRPLDTHAAAASSAALALAEDGAREVSFVGHSLGGLVARSAVARAAVDGWAPGRLVLVGSPARGSAIARVLSPISGYALLGECGRTITPQGAAAVPVPACKGIAVIAGGTGGRGFNPLLPGDNDFTVTVAETRLPGAEDGFMLVRAMHNPLAGHRVTIGAVTRFLVNGRLGE